MIKIINVEKITNIFGNWINFHDAEITKVKYDGNDALIEIDCEGFIKTMVHFDKRYDQIKNILVKIKFKNISHFEIDYDSGMNFINELKIEEVDSKIIVTIDSYYLNIICDYVEIENVSVTHRKNTELLDKYLKSNI